LLAWARLGGALAAHTLALLGLSLDGVHDLHEGRHHLSLLRIELDKGVGSTDSSSQVSGIGARAAASLGSALTGTSVAGRALADKLALRLRASDGLLALPVALSGLAHRGANSVGGPALSAAVGGRANSLALRAILLLAKILRATDVALGLIAVDLALSTFSLFAMDLALWSLAHRVADGRADRIVALPSAFRVAITLYLNFAGSDEANSEKGEQDEDKSSFHLRRTRMYHLNSRMDHK